MPLHPVPIILGTSLAVIGGGYAFKKFVYDPHLAPFIEAFIASRQANSRRAVAVPVSSHTSTTPTYASSTARQDRASELRRRRKSSGATEVQELEHLIAPLSPLDHPHVLPDDPHGPAPHLPLEYELREKRSDSSLNGRESDAWGRRSAYELRNDSLIFAGPSTNRVDRDDMLAVMDENTYRRSPGTTIKAKRSDPDLQHLIQLESPELGSRELLFSASADTLNAEGDFRPPSPSTTGPGQVASSSFSLLTLSPERPAQPLDAPSASDVTRDNVSVPFTYASPPRRRRTSIEDDVISLADTSTSTSGYEDAESYSPVSGAQSPARLHLSSTSDQHAAVRQAPLLDLSGLEQATLDRRGPESVLSLSESEGWGGESDWTGVSE